MTSVEMAIPRRGGALRTVLRALWPARTWRATLHALTGLPLGVAAFALTCGLPVGAGYSAIWSLLYASGDDLALTILFIVLTVTATLALPWVVRGLSAVQRRRFRALLGVEIPPSHGWWRQAGYHVLSLVIGVSGAAAVAGCWSATLLAWAEPVALVLAVPALVAAPWVARVVARADTAAARALLGPSRTEELSVRVATLSRSRAEVVAATDAERRRIERDLHDGAQQRLVSLAMNLGMARANLTDLPAPARQAIVAAHDEATQALAELRDFVRGLHPAVLDDRGLDAALSGIAARAPVPVRVAVSVPGRCSPVVEAVAYFVVSEALTNIARHAHASRAEVTVDRVADRLRVVVTDDGRGGATLDGGTGLRGLAQRAASVDGTFAVHSPAGGPTTVTVELPCGS
ncbi:signal transduction histidine kinase [Actinoplanes octamycinicus]|uniref:histidine kinase n=1 Tax=Actinoplanes octamycinicus TaxID=135948 RepID=A0A7W7GXC9_9ACTN|nr:sensor histidine kinase [Actinoplanes octamycinicus]MBB4740060.1 signal transduction histidine kinase [Actinoplanes octamycinicus]GIE59455.1 histidine kinase [Actinoplanes octamycinicus]